MVRSSVGLAAPDAATQQQPEESGPKDASTEARVGQALLTPPNPLSTPIDYPAGTTERTTVTLLLTIAADGLISDCQVLEGHDPFGEAAIASVKRWRFTPAMVNGVARAAKIRFQVDFVPPPPEESQVPPNSLPGTTEEPPALGVSKPPLQVSDRAKETELPVEVLVAGTSAAPTQTLTSEEVRTLPGAFGDGFRAVDVLAGVSPMATGIPYFYVRGAPPADTGFQFDGVTLPALYHVGAGPAVVHPSLVERVDLHAGSYPAQLGAMVGGFVVGQAVNTRGEARRQASLRLADAGAFMQAPLANGRGEIIVAGRYSYSGWLVSQFVDSVKWQYWDAQSRTTVQVTPKDQLQLLYLGAHDFLAQRFSEPVLSSEMEDNPEQSPAAGRPFHTMLDLTFHRLDMRWLRDIDGGTWTTAVTAGFDKSGIGNGAVTSSNRQVALRSHGSVNLGTGMLLRTGVSVAVHGITQKVEDGYFDPNKGASVACAGAAASDCESGASDDPVLGDEDYELGVGNRVDTLTTAYSEWVLPVDRRVLLSPGLRIDLFSSGSDTAIGVDPRVRAEFRVGRRVSISQGLGVAHQRPSFAFTIPGGTPTLKGGLQRVVQSDASVAGNVGDVASFKIGVFRNLFFGVTDGSAVPVDNNHGHVRANGGAVGLELMGRKLLSHGWSGLVSYTLSRSDRSRDLYSGPAGTDRTRVVNAAVSYEPNSDWGFGMRGMYYSGTPVHVARGESTGRAPPFWRLDVRAQREWTWSDGPTLRIVLEVLNATLNEEVTTRYCGDAQEPCRDEKIGPVVLPNLGAEVMF